jgi:hypothetical protein
MGELHALGPVPSTDPDSLLVLRGGEPDAFEAGRAQDLEVMLDKPVGGDEHRNVNHYRARAKASRKVPNQSLVHSRGRFVSPKCGQLTVPHNLYKPLRWLIAHLEVIKAIGSHDGTCGREDLHGVAIVRLHGRRDHVGVVVPVDDPSDTGSFGATDS